ncbi:CAP-Gly domain-containing linker protein 1 isoform X2 [Sipha flava]|uniref:CAP-Gly domain-containing linker protein 1 isoform X2 n=1 Tax=Sipha flava TaxID=143950 RepID=A0A8B8GQA6_9HEMI|nr:CAP-Gly domain-containing linker protein 1 isoform X2 [Sipha flava]
MPNPVVEEKIIPRHLDLFCRADDLPHSHKYNDGFNKKPLDERKSSSGSESFMGDARRLSEAGIRRSSGNSVVLTEDTDKFIIGNRIWVGGTKPGQIAYIGETNFGSGDWAGIVLDEPIGKNDGSVSGTRYFQCEPKRGIFARLTNLTSAPLSSIEDSMIQSSFSKAKPLGFSTPMPKRETSTVTTIKPSTKGITQSTVSKSTSDLKIGDRVIISSGQGSKLGILKYRGATQFAPGEWCGIELDDPLGKNNGTVEGIKYFECEDKFGLFTPIAKVSKSPMSSSRMSTNCAIHKAKRSPDSLNGSMISTITSNTMSSIPSRQVKISDLDRLKLQLTQMKKENELLRSQVTKAANQADVAEKKLEEILKVQVDKSSETQINNINLLKQQLNIMQKQMDEEKEKVQNLQFTNEEQNVVNIELQNKNTELLIKIKELKYDLDKERNLTKDVEKETMKIFEKEEELCRIKEELESLKKVIDNNEDELQKSVSNLSSEVVDKETHLNILRQTLNENSQTHDRLLKEANEKLFATTEHLNKVIEEKDKKIEQNQEMIDQLNEGIKCLSALKNEEHDDTVNNLKNELSKLKDEYKVIIDKHEQELASKLENKNRQIEQLQKNHTDIMCLNDSEKNIIEKLKLNLHTTTEELKELKAKQLIYNKEAFEKILKQPMQLALINIEELSKDFNKSLILKNKQIEICNITLMKIKTQIIKSKSQLETTFNNKVKEKDDEIKNLSVKLNAISENFEQLEKVYQNVNIELKSALQSVKDKTTLLAELKKKYDDLESVQELNRNELEKELTTKLKIINDEFVCLKSEKSMLEEKYESYVKEMEKIIEDKDNKLIQDNILIENLNISLKELTISKQNELDIINKKVLQLEEDKKQILKHQQLELTTKDELINSLTNKLEQTLTEKQKQDINNANLQSELINETTNYQFTIKELQDKINQLDEKITSNEEIFKKELESKNFEKESIKLENSDLIKKLNLLENSKLNLEEKLALNEVCMQDIQNLNLLINEKDKIIGDNQIKIKELDHLILQTKNRYDAILKKKEEEIKELLKIGDEKLSLEEKTKIILDEKDKEHSKLKVKIEDLESMKKTFEKQLEASELREQDLNKLNEIIREKIKIIEEKNLKIEHLNNLILQTKTKYDTQLQEKDHINELLKTNEEKLNLEKKRDEAILAEKNKEISLFVEKLNTLENIKLNLDEQIKISEKQDHEITELKKDVENKTKAIEDSNLKIELLNNIIVETKTDLEMKVKEREKKIKELEKIGEDKLIKEKIGYETCLTEKNIEIEILKNRLQEFVENNTENELMLKLESANEELNKERVRVANLEVLKKELEKTVSEHKTAFEQLELSKKDMIKTIEEQNILNAELKAKNKIESDQLDVEKLEIQKQINELKNKCSVLQSAFDDKNNEIEHIKKNVLMELKKVVEDKTKIIDDKNSKIDQLSNTIMLSEVEFSTKLKEKENNIVDRIKITEDKFIKEKLILENNTQILLDEKDKEISLFVEKLNTLENIKLNLDEQIKISEKQDHEITELKKDVENKTKAIEDSNLKIELLNNIILETKTDLEMKVKEREKKIKELEKIGEDKLIKEKIGYETCLTEKNTEIEILKNQLQEFVENNTEKELMLKLESANEELNKERVRVANLEVLKKELEKTVSEHKTAFEQLELSKKDMIKTIEEQNILNAELKAKNKIESDQLDGEKLKIQKQINELKNECSVLQSTLGKKNLEIEQLKSQNLESVNGDSKELNRLKALLEKDRSTQSHLEFRIQELTDENHYLNERIEGNRNLLQRNHNDNQEKYNLEKKYEETYSLLKIKENQILVLQTELNSWKLKDMEKCKNNIIQDKPDKSDVHLLAEKNEEIKILNSIILGLHKKLSAVMETDVSEFEIEKNPNGVSKEDYQKLYKATKNNVKLKECENLSLKQEIYKLKTENERYSEFKTKCESLENDKKVLQRLVVNYESSQPAKVKNEKTDDKSETEKILEEKDWQINLLNNIIAGLHTKVSENKFKIEALEKQILDCGLDQNKKVRLRTTRLYCEQCEIFDSHDNEDCPEKPKSPEVQRKRRVVNDGSNKTAEEPFCVCCDMFGHTADECDSSLTF